MERLHTISEQEVLEMSSTLTSRLVTEVVAQVQSMMGQLSSTPLDIAVTGESGSGKSSFINAFRGLGDEDVGASPTGVTETTAAVTPYCHPTTPTIRLWDLPGIGTPSFLPETYLEQVQLQRFDFFIIVTSGRFRECHVALARCVLHAGKRFYFVRNKVDLDVEASCRRRGGSLQAVLTQIRQDCEASLRRLAVPEPRVFLLSCFQPQSLDFPRLQETLQDELEEHKRHVLLLALPGVTRRLRERRTETLRAGVWRDAVAACLTAFTPGLGMGACVPVLMDTMRRYQQSFGLDANSLQRLAVQTGIPYPELCCELRSTSAQELSADRVESMLSQAAVGQQVLAGVLESRVPVLGSVAAGGVSFIASYYLLKSAVQDLSDDAERVMQKALPACDAHHPQHEDIAEPPELY